MNPKTYMLVGAMLAMMAAIADALAPTPGAIMMAIGGGALFGKGYGVSEANQDSPASRSVKSGAAQRECGPPGHCREIHCNFPHCKGL